MSYLLWILQILLVPALAPLGVGLIDSLKAKLQRKTGPSLWQPYRNLNKLFHKDEVISHDASYIFRSAPYIVFAVSLVIAASIPILSSALPAPTGDLITVIYVLAIGTFFLALAGMDVGSGFGGFGSSREVTVSALAEGSFIFSILVVALTTGTTELSAIAGNITSHYAQSIVAILMAFVAFVIVLVAETNRYPFDNPDTHLELTMIHEAMLLEYSGKKLALMEWAAANKLLLLACLAVNLFFPIGLPATVGLGAVLGGLSVLLLKLLVIYVAIALVESFIAKFRFFRLPDLLFTALIFNIVAIGLITLL